MRDRSRGYIVDVTRSLFCLLTIDAEPRVIRTIALKAGEGGLPRRLLLMRGCGRTGLEDEAVSLRGLDNFYAAEALG